jgi:regulatory protein
MSSPASPEKDRIALRSRALAILARREHSRAELRRKLVAFSDDTTLVEAVLDELTARKLLSDERYAELRADSLARKFGSARIEHELRAKGVSRSLASQAAGASRQTELERARGVWAKRFGAAPRDALEKARQMRFLQGRGFSFDAIRAVLGSGSAAEDE